MNPLGLLRTVKESELLLMLSWRNAPAVRANMYTRHEISEQEHLAWWSRAQQRDDQCYFMYERDGQPLGIVGVSAIDRTNGNCAWAFYASPDAPKGSGSRMEFLALEHVFSEMKMHKLHCEVLAYNTAVIQLHQKFGFSVEGVLRQQHRHETGYVDIYRLGLLQTEWAGKRASMLNKLTTYAKG